MALFPVLEIEKAVQLNDKTRLDGSKSFVSRGATAISTLTVTPGVGETPISVYDSAEVLNWYLDWKFSSFKLDVDSTNNKIDFKEGGAELTATVADGSYTLSTIATAIETAMNAAGGTYTVTIDKDEKMTITGLVAFTLLPLGGTNRDTSTLPHLGFKQDFTVADIDHEGAVMDAWIRKVTLTAGDGATTATESKYIKVLQETGDALFSNDSDLVSHEHDILKYVPPGRSSFKQTHRRVQELILAWLDEQGYVNVFGHKFTKFDIKDVEEVRQWATAMALKLIFRSVANAIDDVFSEKAKEYAIQEIVHRNRAVLRIDIDEDGEVDSHEQLGIGSGTVVRR